MEFNVKEFRKYSQFGNVATMDQVIYEYVDILNAKRVAKSVIKLLMYLGSSSLMIPGVSWNKQATIAKELDYDVKTIYNGMELLIEFGMIAKERTTSNWETSTGGAKKRQGVNVIIIQSFISEPVPNNIPEQDSQSLEVDEANEDKDSEGENKWEPCSSNHSLKQNNNHLNNRRSPYIQFVPKSLQHYQAFFGKHLKDLYGRVWLAVKNLGIVTDQGTMQSIGFTVMERLKQYVNEGKKFTEEQLCKLAYKISYNQLEQGIARGEIDDKSSLYAIVDNAMAMRLYHSRNKATREELDELELF